MKKKELAVALESLASVAELKGVKFAYTVIKNKKKIEEEIKNIQEASKPTPEFEEFEKKRIEICSKYSEKDANNEPIVEENRYKIIDTKAFNVEFDKAKADNKEILDARTLQIKEYEALLEEDTNLTFDKISISELPVDITAAQIDGVEFMIIWD